ncbi:MAG TPA: 6-phosphofructokinase, partial [Ktedonobacteraceae bacterium]
VGYVIVVAAETVREEHGQPLGAALQVGTDAFQHPLLSGAAQYLVDVVMRELKLRARFDKPGDLQRMASNCISPIDQAEAYLVGEAGLHAVMKGESGKMVTLIRHDEPTYHCTTGLVDLDKVANMQRLLPAEYLDTSRTMVTPAFHAYASPLVGGELTHHARLKMTKAQMR